MPPLNRITAAACFLTLITVLMTQQPVHGQPAECLRWVPATPEAVIQPAVVYDSVRNVLVLHGGLTYEGQHKAETWEWDGTAWHRRAITGPAPRYRHAMAFDSARGVTVLYGGEANDSEYHQILFGDTWEWNGRAWRQRADSGPGTLTNHTMAYDPVRQRTVLFGGYTSSGGYKRDTWQWDGTSWSLASSAGPTARIDSAMTFHPGQSAIMLYGGFQNGWPAKEDLWKWDGTSWAEIDPSAWSTWPGLRGRHSMVYDPTSDRLLLYGGGYYSGGTTYDRYFWEWNAASNQWTRAAAQAPFFEYEDVKLVYNPTLAKAMLYGGYFTYRGQIISTNLWGWNGSIWSTLHGNPSARQDGRMEYDPLRHQIIMYGGSDYASSSLNETWRWDGNRWTSSAALAVTGRSSIGTAFDIVNDVLVLFGGSPAHYGWPEDRAWHFDPGTDVWSEDTNSGPAQRSSVTMVYDSSRHECLLFGGLLLGNGTNETWTYDAAAEAWIQKSPAASPSPRYNAAMAFDGARNQAVLFGGWPGWLGDTWLWNGTTWLVQTPAHLPRGRIGAQMTYDSFRQKVVLFGGQYLEERTNDVWEWNGSDWTERTDLGEAPKGRAHAYFAYDEFRREVVLFGGATRTNLLGDTWVLRTDPDTDGDLTVDCSDACPFDALKTAEGVCGCGFSDVATDTDGDGTADCIDPDIDGDGTANLSDECPLDSAKTAAGICGCGTTDTDTDSDGAFDCSEECDSDPAKTAPGACGCGTADADSDGDGTMNCVDSCADDPAKSISAGACGCGVAETDGDGDGTPNCDDTCVSDPAKSSPGACGCGVADTDSDGDGTANCNDDCASDPNKSAVGLCGCGVPETDGDSDGTPDCSDQCAADSAKTSPGACGCGVSDADANGNGKADCLDPKLQGLRPGTLRLSMNGAKVRVTMTPVEGVKYVVSYQDSNLLKVKKGKKPPAWKVKISALPVLDVAGLKKNATYVFTYHYLLDCIRPASSLESARKSIKVVIKKNKK